MKCCALIVAAGSGSRMGGPKQFLPLLGRSVVEWSLEAFRGVPDVEQIVLVLGRADLEKRGSALASAKVRVVEGGATRLDSVRNGFREVPEDADVVAIHDGARPLITPEIIQAVIEEAQASGAALPAVPVRDTLKKVANKQLWITATPARSLLWAAQTPQCYRREVLAETLDKFASQKDATDESQLVERAGHKVKVVPSTAENLKITYPEDMVVSEALLKRRLGLSDRPAVGFGFDIHKLVVGRPLWLGGVQIEHAKGLLGHSDGDVILHAASDAVLGALGEGEIGIFFPPGESATKGIESRKIVAAVLEKLKSRRGTILNLDVTVVAEEPKLSPHYPKIKESLSSLFGLPPERVNLKAKTHEGLDALGQGLAIGCYATATLFLAD